MDFNTLLTLIAVLACPVGMGLMMWWMSKSMSADHSSSSPKTQSSTERLAALRARREALEAEMAEIARIAELQAKRQPQPAEQGSNG